MKKIFVFFSLLFIIYSLNSQVVINEVMYAPTSETEQEWFEIYNSGTYPINLLNWKWKDATSTLRIISTISKFIDQHEYAIICQDSAAVRQYHPGFSGLIFQTSWSTLNNDTDNVVLIDGSVTGIRIDSLRYISSWGGKDGYSLERKNPVGLTNDSTNWGTSIDFQKSTPNRLNSITPKQNDLKLYSIIYSPQSPRAGDTLFLKFNIKNIGLNPANNFSLNIYRNLSLDSIIRPSELIHTQNFAPFVLNPNDSLIYIYSIAGIDSGMKQYIGKIIYTPDNDTTNNYLIK
ncbi:MAG: lamin tail domain-containing protein, partial [Ignavibacteriae bacterium]|nr:lamin tail domain-containing protein [Ignavibacteriota bacterium]